MPKRIYLKRLTDTNPAPAGFTTLSANSDGSIVRLDESGIKNNVEIKPTIYCEINLSESLEFPYTQSDIRYGKRLSYLDYVTTGPQYFSLPSDSTNYITDFVSNGLNILTYSLIAVTQSRHYYDTDSNLYNPAVMEIVFGASPSGTASDYIPANWISLKLVNSVLGEIPFHFNVYKTVSGEKLIE